MNSLVGIQFSLL